MSTPADAGSVAVVTLAAVYTEQVKMSAQLAVLTDRLSTLPDHESRIRRLEAWRYALPPAVFTGLTSFIVSVAALLHH